MATEYDLGSIIVGELRNEYATQEPTARIRWSKDGILQQAWLTRRYQNGVPISEGFDWMPVPIEGE